MSPATAAGVSERLCRYVARPPLAAGSLTQISEEVLSFKLKTPWSDGTTSILLSPMELISHIQAHQGCSFSPRFSNRNEMPPLRREDADRGRRHRSKLYSPISGGNRSICRSSLSITRQSAAAGPVGFLKAINHPKRHVPAKPQGPRAPRAQRIRSPLRPQVDLATA